MKAAAALLLVALLGFAAGYAIRAARSPIGRFAFVVPADSTGAPLRLDTSTGALVLCIPGHFQRLDPEAYLPPGK